MQNFFPANPITTNTKLKPPMKKQERSRWVSSAKALLSEEDLQRWKTHLHLGFPWCLGLGLLDLWAFAGGGFHILGSFPALFGEEQLPS